MNRTRSWPLTLAASLAAGLATACTTATQAQSTAPATAPRVAVALARQQDVPLEARFTGRVESPDRVELRPRVGGALDAVLYREGSTVRAGDPLFRIDRRPYEIAVRRARAEAATVTALLTRARAEFARATRLAAEDAVSAEELDRRRGEVEHLEARAEVAAAAVADAALSLEWTIVRAPVSGRIGKAEVTAGNIVRTGPGDGTRLAVLQSTTPLHVYFDLDPETAHRARGGDRRAWRALVAPFEGGPAIEGRIDFVDSAVGAQSGTLKVRATVPNTDGRLVPSAVVRVDFRYGTADDVTLVPERAIASDQAGRYVLVADAAGVLAYRAVSLGARVGEWRAVTNDTVAAGDQVVLPGLPGLRPGMTVVATAEVAK